MSSIIPTMPQTPTHPKLQAALAHAGVASRRQAESLIAAGQVTVNGQTAHLGQRIDPAQDVVKVQQKTISLQPQQPLYILVNKPAGYVSTTADELGRPTVLELLPPELTQERLYPVGRLDIDSQGLLLLTNDGQLAYRLTHPKFEIAKTYQVTLDRGISELALAHLQRGVKLKDGWAKPQSVLGPTLEVARPGSTELQVTITEGRNRQVRRMLERVGYQVTILERVKFGPWSLEDLDGQVFKKIHLTASSPTLSELGFLP